MKDDRDRRRYGRIELDEALPGAVGEVPVRVTDVSVTGFRVLHEARFPPGEAKQIRIEWEGQTLRFAVHIARSTLFKLAASPGEKSIYQSGVNIDSAPDDSESVLRNLIADRVIRALEEQKDNARGVPPSLSKYTMKIGNSNRFRRCELIDGRWRKSETPEPSQPESGFTISSDIDPMHIEMLCNTWERTSEEGRRLTRILAELSIRKNEGVTVRRYSP